MKHSVKLGSLVFIIFTLLLSACSSGSKTINVVTAGDTNMVELQTDIVGKEFLASNEEGYELNVVGTGSGDAGSQKIYAKLKAQKDAGKTEWDIDVAIVHQSIMKEMMEEGLLEKYVPLSANKEYVTSPDSKNSLGIDIDGYAIPLFHSQVALGYNPDKVSDVPQSFEDLVQWINDNPERFGYNGIKNGMSGVAFTTAYTYWKSGDYNQLAEGPYDPALEEKWPEVMKELKALPVTYTGGNNATLDMMNRGEIDMGPVWVDMFISWKGEGRLNPDFRLKIIEPGLPGQPMYVVVPKNAANKEAALAYADFLTSPEIQASAIVDSMGWFPGIDAASVMPNVSEEGKESLFSDISAEDLANKGLSFPLVDYFSNLKEAYERN
ncbi:extracellular solute-binding protein [Chengkuizengella sediminis]|uniref:extracellular solute-binding protein n=1 Tax=Chengkuizengella sediminis TaxID=1885917 RepID=UPI00138A4832|nr:extracellular solute-binding protein [Chengkuizengella sediminis]NDI34930.1 extracellular solute-binding protein [Chengkuizengella sediminis]